jgi:hypothetical protein
VRDAPGSHAAAVAVAAPSLAMQLEQRNDEPAEETLVINEDGGSSTAI